MLRRRESAAAHNHRTSLPSTAVSPSSNYGSPPFLAVRNHSVATSNPSYHEHANVTRSFLSTASSSSLLGSSSSNIITKSFSSWLFYIPALLLLITSWSSPHHLQEDIQKYQTEILTLQQQQQELVKELDAMTKSIKEFSTKVHAMDKQNNERFQDLRESKGVFSDVNLGSEQYAQVEKAEEGLFRRLDTLEKYIQKRSAELAVQKFGSEPYRVKVNVEDLRGEISSFVIELAPISEMPYAVYHFLQMVDQNLWDGLSLMLNGATNENNNNHWLASPMLMDPRHGQPSWEGQRFENANLTHMAFTEHSPTYPPPGKFQYSVAFSGHPGGPTFYIRLDHDSPEEHITDIHQQSTTFGLVVEGMDMLHQYSGLASNHNKPNEAKDHRVTGHKLHMLTIQNMELLRSADSDIILTNSMNVVA